MKWAYSSKAGVAGKIFAAPQQASHYDGRIMALSLFAAQALVESYLEGRQLPDALLLSIRDAVEARLKSGKMPVLDDSLRELIDTEAIEPARPMPVKTPVR